MNFALHCSRCVQLKHSCVLCWSCVPTAEMASTAKAATVECKTATRAASSWMVVNCGERWHDHDRPPPLANGVVQSRQEQHQPSLQPHSHTTPELAQRTRQRREQRRTLSVTVRFHVPPHPTLTQRVCHLLTAMHSHYCGCLCAFTTTSLTEAMMLFYTRCTLG